MQPTIYVPGTVVWPTGYIEEAAPAVQPQRRHWSPIILNLLSISGWLLLAVSIAFPGNFAQFIGWLLWGL